jgi:hypothetical protein
MYPTFKNDLFEFHMNRLNEMSHAAITQEVLNLRYERALLEEQSDWLDRLADALRDGEDTTDITKDYNEAKANIKLYYLQQDV